MWNTKKLKINFHLIRHGKTLANEKKLYYGFSDINLSEKGIEELINLKNSLSYPKADLFIISGLKRTLETLNIIYGKKKYYINENLKEMNFGNFELKHYNELKYDKEYLNWIENIETYPIPNGEKKCEFEKRVILGFYEVFNECIKNNTKDVVFICHSGVIASYMQYIFPKENKNFYDWLPDCGRGYTITFEKSNNIYYKKI